MACAVTVLTGGRGACSCLDRHFWTGKETVLAPKDLSNTGFAVSCSLCLQLLCRSVVLRHLLNYLYGLWFCNTVYSLLQAITNNMLGLWFRVQACKMLYVCTLG